MSGPSCEVPPKSAAEIFGLAAQIRKDLQVQSDAFPILELLELGMPKFFEGFALEVGDAEEMGPNHGLTVPSENVIRLREDVYEGLCRGLGRDRFTAAHELGHYLMHRNVPIVFNRSARLPAYRDSEWQANRFAGALLMPADRLVTCRSLNEVVNRFGVSSAAAETQNAVLVRMGKMCELS